MISMDACKQQIGMREGEIQSISLPVNQLRVETDRIAAGDRKLLLEDAGLRRFARAVNAPFLYLDDLPPTLRAMLFQHHLDNGDLGQNVSLFARGDRVVAFADPGLLRLSGGEVLDAVLEGFGSDVGNLGVLKLEFLDESVEVDLVGYQTHDEIAPGDVLQAGLRVTHSFIAEHAEWVEAFIFRLVCSNGLVHRECISRRGPRTRRLPVGYPNGKELQRDQLRRLAAQAWEALGPKLGAIRSLANERINFEPLVLRWLEKARLSTRTLMPFLLDAWQAEGAQPTMYAVMNALTFVGTHGEGLTLRQRRILTRLAGLMAFRRIHLCPKCFSFITDQSFGDSPLPGGVELRQSWRPGDGENMATV
jgi:hypothetical protein